MGSIPMDVKKCVVTVLFGCYLLFSIISCKDPSKEALGKRDHTGWETYAGTREGNRYSSNNQIHIGNVSDLQEVWRYSTHDKDVDNRSQNQCNPIVVNGILYGTSPRSKLVALDAATGTEKWVFDPAKEASENPKGANSFFNVIRGVVYWESKNGKDRRIFYSEGAHTYCINADTGRPIRSFGRNGQIDLAHDLDREPSSFNPYIASTTPGIIYKDLLIMSMRVAESADAAPGHIRAYDARSGKLEWIFHTIPQPGELGHDTWPDKNAWKNLGGANNWAGMSMDVERGIVYVPTGSVSGDFYGGVREGQNLFGNSLIALDAATGEYTWHYQIVHHDLWDRDLPANPNLVTLFKDGDSLDAVAQITKHGYVFLFDRETGQPIFPIEERPVPQNALPGEKPWPTQPIPILPEPFARQDFTENDINTLFPESYSGLMEKFREIKYNEPFAPPSKEGSWIFPGFDGGGEWGGAAVDPQTQILYINSSELPWSLTMIDIPKKENGDGPIKDLGKSVYGTYCVACHGPDLKGNGPSFPSLVDTGKKYNSKEIREIIENGRNMMPAFTQLDASETEGLLAFLTDLEVKGPDPSKLKEPLGEKSKNNILDRIPYTMTGYNRFLDENGYPGISPPWGTLNAVDLNSGKLLWKVPLGEYPELTAKGIPPTGTENYGGPVVTKGGLVFIAATKDSKIRAFDKKTGKILWQAPLPAPGYATPAVYSIDGKQYLVIACGGGKIGSISGDEYVAFALPD